MSTYQNFGDDSAPAATGASGEYAPQDAYAADNQDYASYGDEASDFSWKSPTSVLRYVEIVSAILWLVCVFVCVCFICVICVSHTRLFSFLSSFLSCCCRLTSAYIFSLLNSLS
jgi:ABC-type multidrug transport system permease subunit